jgi:membrane AbrB-like protein
LWLTVILFNATYFVTVVAAGTLFFVRVCRQDLTTGFFSSAPGGLMEMPFLCEALGGDARFASMVHSVRVVIVVLAVPIYIRFAEAAVFSNPPAPPPPHPLSLESGAILIAIAFGGYIVARLLRIPGPALVGPLLASVGFHLAGLTVAKPPGPLFFAAQLVVGTSIGGYFIGMHLRHVGRLALMSLGWTVIMLMLAGLFAGLGAHLFGMDFNLLLLALSPGGQAEMALVALFLGIQVPLVATVHLIRSMSIYAAAPLFFKLFRRLQANRREPGG